MSERGLVLALQRLHDDPGFADLVAQDPQSTLGIYDLDQEERDALFQAVQNRDNSAIRQMAERVGVDWTADHIGGVGAIGEDEEERLRLGVGRPNAMTGDGYDGVQPIRRAGA